jgi:hypothetical protein
MPFVIEPEMGETIILEAEYAASEKSVPFAFGITNRAIFLPAKKTFAMKDPWYFRRVPLSDVREVRIAVLAAIVQGSRSAGIHVLDERSTAG